jgi:hypothetical protein
VAPCLQQYEKKEKNPGRGMAQCLVAVYVEFTNLAQKRKKREAIEIMRVKLLHPSTIAPFSAALKTISATTFLTKSKKFFSSCD